MKNANKKISDTCVRVNCQTSYAYLLTPKKQDDGTEKYQCTFIIKKSDTEAVNLIRNAEAAAKKQYAEKFGEYKGKLKTVVYDGDEEYPGDELYEDTIFVRASSKKAPEVKVADKGMMVDALDESDVYSGCYGAALLNFFPYSSGNSKGVSAGLNGFIKLEDGERLGGSSVNAEQAFGDLL